MAWMGAMRLSVIAALTGANGTVQLFTPRLWTVSSVKFGWFVSSGQKPQRPRRARAREPVEEARALKLAEDGPRLLRASGLPR